LLGKKKPNFRISHLHLIVTTVTPWDLI